MWVIFWEGHGYLAALIPLITFFLYSAIESAFTGSEELSLLALFLPLAVSSFLLWKIGKRLNRKQGRRLIDPETNEEIILKDNHSLFFLKLEYWGILWGFITVLVLIVEITG